MMWEKRLISCMMAMIVGNDSRAHYDSFNSIRNNCLRDTLITVRNGSRGRIKRYISSGNRISNFPDKTRKIGEEAFQNCAGLDSIEIPASVISIGNSAFGYCSGLRSIIPQKMACYLIKKKPRYFVIPLGKSRPCMRFRRA